MLSLPIPATAAAIPLFCLWEKTKYVQAEMVYLHSLYKNRNAFFITVYILNCFFLPDFLSDKIILLFYYHLSITYWCVPKRSIHRYTKPQIEKDRFYSGFENICKKWMRKPDQRTKYHPLAPMFIHVQFLETRSSSCILLK